MTQPARRAATYEDVAQAPSNMVAEILDGELVLSPRPAFRHAAASSSLTGQIMGPFRFGTGGPGGWIILMEPELHFGRDVLVPDLAGWRRERMPEMPDVAYVELAPDWVCEVLSPRTAARDRADKLRLYAREGVASAWLIDPIAQTLEVLRLERERWVIVATHRAEATVRAEPFDAIALDLALLWAR